MTGIGVGPGDPTLLTRRACVAIEEADRVVAPTTSTEAEGRAEGIVREALPGTAITRLPFDMTPDGDGGEDARAASHRAAASRLAPWLDAGEHVAFVTLGDPNIYSTFPALVGALRGLGRRPQVETVPGITAFQALAARSNTPLLDGKETLLLVTALDGTAHLQAALEDDDRAVVVYKGGRYLPEMAHLVEARGRAERAVVGELLGLPGERVRPLAEAGEVPASYLATVIVPPLGRADGGTG